MTPINPLETAEKAMDFADDSFESREEAEATRTRRQEIDMASPFKLPQLIRPIMAIWGMVTYSAAQFYCLYADLITGLEAMGANAAIVMAIVGFYFNSRKAEKTVAKQMAGQLEIVTMKAKTAVAMEKIKTRADIRAEKKKARHERRQERRGTEE